MKLTDGEGPKKRLLFGYDMQAEHGLQHDMTCDCDARVLAWLRATQRARLICDDMVQAVDIAFHDLVSKEFQPVPGSPVVICSWVCCDVSRRNGGKRKYDCISEKSGETGSTFAMFVDYLEVHKPRIFFSEMVAGLKDYNKADPEMLSNHEVVLQKLREAGYSVCFLQVCPSKCGIPMTRQRLYYIGLSKEAHQNSEALAECLLKTWTGICSGKYSEVGLEEFLLPPESHFVQAAKDKASQRRPGMKGGKEEWKKMHSSAFQSHKAAGTKHE